MTAFMLDERLPPPRVPILVFTEAGCELAVYVPGRPGSRRGDFRYRDEDGEEIDRNILYWATIPKLPGL
jgi:hypothetical protein